MLRVCWLFLFSFFGASMRRLFAALLFLAMHVSLHAQQRYFFNQFTSREGLSNNNVNKIIQDSTGFIWIATSDGLNRFDGHHFKVFRHQSDNPNSIPANNVGSLALDREGKIWCGGENWSCVAVYDPANNSFTRIDLQSETRALSVRDLFCDEQGTIWVATDSGIFRWNHATKQIENVCLRTDSLMKPTGTRVMYGGSFAKDKRGEGFWLSTNAGLNYFKYQSGEFQNSKNNPQAKKIFDIRITRSLVTDSRGMIWSNVPTKSKAWKWIGYDPLADSIIFETTDVDLDKSGIQNSFRSYSCSPQDDIWLGNNSRTPLIFHTATRAFDYSLVQLYPGSLTNHTLNTTYFDKSGNIWLGMEEGLYAAFSIYRGVEVNWLGEWDEFRTPRIKSMYQPDSTSLLFAANQQLHWWHRTTGITTSYPIRINGKTIEEDTRYVSRKNDHEVWVATFTSLYSFHLITKTFTDEFALLPPEWKKIIQVNSSLRHIFSSDSGDFFIATNIGLLVGNKQENTYRVVQLPGNTKENFLVTGYSKRSAGGWWFCDHNTSRLFYLEHVHDELHELLLPENFPITAHSICDDQAGSLWIGSLSQGLARLNISSGQCDYYSLQEGLHSNCVYKVLHDKDGEIWAVTSNGVARFNESLQRFEKIFNEYSLSDYSHRDVGHIGLDGRLYLFSQNIFYSLDTKNIAPDNRDKAVLISGVRVMDDEFSLTTEDALKELSHLQNGLTFEFSALNFNPNNAVRYEYMLEDLHTSWQSTDGASYVQFSGLPHGDYIFKVRSDNGTGIFSEKFTSVAFTILPPWYATIWFRLLSVALLVLSTWVVTRAYAKRKMQKREEELEKIRLVEEERMRIARDMHDDLGGGLSSIRMMSESAQRRPDGNKLIEISASATELVERMRQIVWALNQEQNTIEDLCYYIIAHSRDFLRRHEIAVTFSEVIVSDFKLSSKQRRNIFLKVKEALHNIVKHSGASEVEIQLELNEGILKILIADNGQGLPRVSGNRFGNGLRNMKQRVEELGGVLDLVSENGLKIQFSIPLR